MEQRKVLCKILEIYKTCGVKNVPIDCISIIHALGIPIFKYSELSDKKSKACYSISDDAFKLKGKIYYNDDYLYKPRQRFSLMHELGHIALAHTGETMEQEYEANYFASSILAPCVLIHKYNCSSAEQIHDIFGLSYSASYLAFTAYNNWFDTLCRTTRKPSWEERQIELLFFPASNTGQNQAEDAADPQETEDNSQDSYDRLLRIMQMGVGIPSELKSKMQVYSKLGLL